MYDSILFNPGTSHDCLVFSEIILNNSLCFSLTTYMMQTFPEVIDKHLGRSLIEIVNSFQCPEDAKRWL